MKWTKWKLLEDKKDNSLNWADALIFLTTNFANITNLASALHFWQLELLVIWADALILAVLSHGKTKQIVNKSKQI